MLRRLEATAERDRTLEAREYTGPQPIKKTGEGGDVRVCVYECSGMHQISTWGIYYGRYVRSTLFLHACFFSQLYVAYIHTTGRQGGAVEFTYLKPHDSISLQNLGDFGEVSRIVLHFHIRQELFGEHLQEGPQINTIEPAGTLQESRKISDVGGVPLVGKVRSCSNVVSYA